MVQLINKIIVGLLKSVGTVGGTAIKSSKTLTTKTWLADDLQSTPWLYGPEHIRGIVNQAVKNGDSQVLLIVQEYLKRHDVEKLSRYRYIANRVKKALQEIGPDDFF